MSLSASIPPSIYAATNKKDSRHRASNGHDDDDHLYDFHRIVWGVLGHPLLEIV